MYSSSESNGSPRSDLEEISTPEPPQQNDSQQLRIFSRFNSIVLETPPAPSQNNASGCLSPAETEMKSNDHLLGIDSPSRSTQHNFNVLDDESSRAIPTTPSSIDSLHSPHNSPTTNIIPPLTAENIFSNLGSSAVPRGDFGRNSRSLTLENGARRNGALNMSTSSDTSHQSGVTETITSRANGVSRERPRDGPSPPSSPSSSTSTSDNSLPRSPSHERDLSLDIDNRNQRLGIGGAFVWGTNINVNIASRCFSHFLINYVENTVSGDSADTIDMNVEVQPHYVRALHEINQTQRFELDVNCRHLFNHPESRELYNQLVRYPQEMVPIMDLVAKHEFDKIFGEEAAGIRRIQVRPFNLREIKPLRELNPEDIDQLVAVKGMVLRSSAIIPDLKQAFFRCIVCGDSKEVMIDRGRIEEPNNCSHCATRSSYELIHNRCTFTDKQMIRLQETPDEIPQGETPHSVTLFAFDELVDNVRPGDRVEITGVFRAVSKRVHPKQRVVRSVFKTFIDVMHFRLSSAGTTDNRAEGEFAVSATGQFTNEQIRSFQELAADPNVYDKLTRAIAPSIWELDDVKRGILCQMLGGCDQAPRSGGNADEEEDEQQTQEESRDDTRSNRKRGEINVLMCGDPGTSKSQLLSFVHKVAPRGIYTSGKGSSAVGLTASVVRDPETRDLVLESGALVLSDNGICCIDEFDKMSDTTRAVLHEAMEQQTVSVAKAGIICTLNARTAILASANPVQSRYNPCLSVIANIKLPPTLLSRFDLIYLILDKPDENLDRRLAKHLVGLYYKEPVLPIPPLNQDFLKKFIAYARAKARPQISDAAGRDLIQAYLDMRRLGGGGKTITATPRQLESLIRISEALAKMRLAEWVVSKDVAEAYRLMKVSTQSAATDPRTGTIDMDMINTGRGAVDREGIHALANEIRALLERTATKGRRMTVAELKRSMARQSDIEITLNDLLEVLRQLDDEQFLRYNDRAQTVLIR